MDIKSKMKFDFNSYHGVIWLSIERNIFQKNLTDSFIWESIRDFIWRIKTTWKMYAKCCFHFLNNNNVVSLVSMKYLL